MSCYFYFELFPLDLSCDVCNVIPLYCSVNGYVCLVCLTLFVNGLVKQFAISLGVVVILLLMVMDVLSVGEGALLDRPYIGIPRNVCVVYVGSYLLTFDVVALCDFAYYVVG